MLVMKFGGTSMGSAARMCNSVDIIQDRSKNDRLGVIVSAVGGVSNRLQDSITFAMHFYTAATGDFSTSTTTTTTTTTTALQDKGQPSIGGFGSTKEIVDSIKKTHADIARELESAVPGFKREAVDAALGELYAEYERLLEAVASFGECPESIECRIMGMGERFCVPIVAEILRARGEDVGVLDSRKYIVTEGRLTEGDPIYDKTEANFLPWRDKGPRVLLAAGFISSDVSGKPSLLGRNGSDFSAAIMAMGLKASKLEIWSDVDGIYSADPRIVPDAVLVNDISYEEAMELSFFGSKVLHPKTITPIAARRIETWSLNSFNRAARGTRIAAADSIAVDPAAGPVRGVSCLKDAALVSVAGAGLKGKRGTAARVFSAVSRSGVSVLLITQSSSEYTISFCVKGREAHSVKKVLEEEFALEMRENLIDAISVIPKMAIVSIVGDGMKQRRGVAGTFFSALAFGGINIHAIAQGSSERSISTVVAEADGDKAVRIAHRFFFNTMQTIEVFLFGIGTVGGKLLEQIRLQQEELRKSRVDLQVWGIANSRRLAIAKYGIKLNKWKETLEASAEPSSVDAVLQFVKSEKPLNPVFVDCTATGALPERYPDIFRAGMHVVTPNKQANSLSLGFYHELREVASASKKRFLYETNVGAGLPVIDTFRNMLTSGDALIAFSGIMSGSLSYVFGRLDEGVSFSRAVLEAKEKGFTEPDPRDDLSGLDVARKALIIAREAGISIELSDIAMVSPFPAGFDQTGTVHEFLARLPSIDGWFAERMAALKAAGKTLRFAASIDGQTGTARVGAIEVPLEHPLAAIHGGENAFVFTTKYYSPIPLIIRGYGAGADVTASGIFADIMRTTKW
ncbi:MAG TPA: bifunctional aspartate kinase/homoserine dehydrogenase I [Treponemataceae bacterium]|nr:bifunctional aspartate kinase/homoserine dehydrogenase I [Treponemataceae bacterium]